jgi:hypothetical protein
MRFCVRAVAVLMAVAFALPAVVGQPPGAGQPTPGAPAAPQPAKPQLTVKVFKLERGDPEAVVSSLHALLEGPDAEATPPPGVGAPGGLGIMGVPPGGLPGGFGGMPAGGPGGFGGVPGPAGGAAGFGGIGCFLGTGGGNATPVWRATTHARTRAVVVRGAARHLAVAADLVAIHDRPAGAPLPKLQAVTALALKHAAAEELAEVIGALSFDGVKLATPGERLLAVVAPDDVARAVAELVRELDVPGAGGPDPEPRKGPKKGPKPNEAKPPR